MSEHLEAAMDQFRQGRRRKYGPYNTDKPPTDEEITGQTPEQRDSFSLFTAEQLAEETRSVRWEVTFGDVIKIRDQAEMIMAACRLIIERTRDHAAGPDKQRVDCRREAASAARALTRFNGKTPYGEKRKRPRNY